MYASLYIYMSDFGLLTFKSSATKQLSKQECIFMHFPIFPYFPSSENQGSNHQPLSVPCRRSAAGQSATRQCPGGVSIHGPDDDRCGCYMVLYCSKKGELRLFGFCATTCVCVCVIVSQGASLQSWISGILEFPQSMS